MVLRFPGQGSPGRATAIAAVGETILFAAGSGSGGGQNGGAPRVLEAEGARPSCWDNREPEPTTSAQHQTPARCELPSLHPDDAAMELTGE